MRYNVNVKNILTFIHLGSNPRLVSGFSRKAYQVEVKGTTVYRYYGPVSVIRRKTVWDRKVTKVDNCGSVAEATALVRKIIGDRLAHGYSVAKPGEVPVN
jgi:hypothetical protein